MLLITLIRHGNTDANKQRILQGQTDTVLNELGHRQAALVGKRLANEHFDKVYCSDLTRCKQTAQAILDIHHQDTPITYLSGLRERSFGDLSNQPISHLFALGQKVCVKTHGGETEQEFTTRVLDTYNDLVKEATTANYQHILIVTHGGPLRSLCLWWSRDCQYDGSRDRLRRGHHGNTGLSQIRHGDPIKVDRFNCMDHLRSIGLTDDDIPPSV
ncbi:histidine phosphatase superfamily, partial [Chlamydoabsidia padenii]